MKTYSIKDIFYTSWSELTPGQMLLLIELSDQITHFEKDSKEYGFVLIGILRLLRKNKQLVSKMDEEQALDCFNDITFFSRTPEGTFQTPWYFFPVAGFNLNEFVFTSPTPSDLPLLYHSFQQLVYADTAFSAFCLLNYQYNQTDVNEEATRKQIMRDIDEALCSLIAVIYTRAEDFDVADMEVRARLISLKLNIKKRSLILLTYANIRQFITDRCPNLFPKPPKENVDESEPQPPTFTGPMWMNLRYDLAKTEVFKGFKTASDARIYDALDFLEKESIDAQTQNANGKA